MFEDEYYMIHRHEIDFGVENHHRSKQKGLM